MEKTKTFIEGNTKDMKSFLFFPRYFVFDFLCASVSLWQI